MRNISKTKATVYSFNISLYNDNYAHFIDLFLLIVLLCSYNYSFFYVNKKLHKCLRSPVFQPEMCVQFEKIIDTNRIF